MSVYYDRATGFYVVRSYIRGAYSYIGRRKTREEADELDQTWKDELASQTGDIDHTTAWFEAESKNQVQNLYKNYPPFTTTGGLKKDEGSKL